MSMEGPCNRCRRTLAPVRACVGLYVVPKILDWSALSEETALEDGATFMIMCGRHKCVVERRWKAKVGDRQDSVVERDDEWRVLEC